MRNLKHVILQMLEIIPDSRNDLKEKLMPYLHSDNSYEDWNDVGDLLFNEVFTDYRPEEEWMLQLDVLWTGDENPYDLSNSNF